MKKNKGHKSPEMIKSNIIESLHPYSQSRLSNNAQEIASALKALANTYNFSYRLFPTGTDLTEEARRFRTCKHSLDTTLATLSCAFISLSILLSLSSITGNVVSEPHLTMPDTNTIRLFVAGLCSTGLLVSSRLVLATSRLFTHHLSFNAAA